MQNLPNQKIAVERLESKIKLFTIYRVVGSNSFIYVNTCGNIVWIKARL